MSAQDDIAMVVVMMMMTALSLSEQIHIGLLLYVSAAERHDCIILFIHIIIVLI